MRDLPLPPNNRGRIPEKCGSKPSDGAIINKDYAGVQRIAYRQPSPTAIVVIPGGVAAALYGPLQAARPRVWSLLVEESLFVSVNLCV
jgi:hypothetical protein